MVLHVAFVHLWHMQTNEDLTIDLDYSKQARLDPA